MFELVYFVTGVIGSVLASITDLKTTEIPDKIPYAMIAIAIIFFSAESILTSNYLLIGKSFFVGLSFLGFGFLMYYLGQWGGGDAKILSAIGFLFPELPKGFNVDLILPFPLSFLFNLFFLGSIYMLFYSFVLSIMNKTILFEF